MIAETTAGGGEAFVFPRPWWRDLNPFDHFSPERIAKDGVSRTWQDIRLFPTHSLRDNVILARHNPHGEGPVAAIFRRSTIRRDEAVRRREADALLTRFGLAGRETSSADMVSLGQSKRVAIARTVQAGARILFLDEPLAALDSKGIHDVMSLLTTLVADHRVTLVIVEHVFNIPKILDIATTVWTIRDGKIVTESVEEVRSEPSPESADLIPPWLASIAGSSDAIIETHLPGGARILHVQLDPSYSRMPGLDVKNLIVTRGRRPVIGRTNEAGKATGLSFSLPRGSLGVLEAPNGWGKTTFLEALAGVIPIQSGEVRIYDKPIQNLKSWDRVKTGLAVLQSRDNIFPNLLVEDALSIANIAEPPESVRPFIGRHVSDLSGGQRQRVALACALAHARGTATILDEPFGMLDVASIPQVQSQIVQNTSGVTLILMPAASQS